MYGRRHGGGLLGRLGMGALAAGGYNVARRVAGDMYRGVKGMFRRRGPMSYKPRYRPRSNWRGKHEWKVIDYTTTNVDQGAAATWDEDCALINGVTAGTGEDKRNGADIVIRKIQIQGTVYGIDTTANSTWIAAIVMDSKPGAAVPTFSDVYNELHTDAMLNLDTTRRFRILGKLRGVIAPALGGGTSTFGGVPSEVPIDMSLNGAWRIHYKSDGNLIGDLEEGAMYILLAREGTASKTVRFHYSMRLRYQEE